MVLMYLFEVSCFVYFHPISMCRLTGILIVQYID
uniref:Uncharacterized protein n=1 Tax=Arundo donax TaxID=35708 RepID=A0A0A9F3A3_ARUDO